MCPNEQLLILAHERMENMHEQSETKVVSLRHPITSITLCQTLMDSKQILATGSTIIHISLSSHFQFLSQSLIHNLLLLLPYLHIVATAPTAELLPSINT
jgi:hypothetical protein